MKKVELFISESSYVSMAGCRANANNTAMRCNGIATC